MRVKGFIRKFIVIGAALGITVLICSCSADQLSDYEVSEEAYNQNYFEELADVPEFTDDPYVIINDNEPEFTEDERESKKSFEKYSRLDKYGRCGEAYANLNRSLMPTEDREDIGEVKPTGWQTVRYDKIIKERYLYNRCHLIGFQLAGENANERNLITGTRYMNVEGMLPFEDDVADYIKDTGNHVLYRVTPIYQGANLVASGVQMEAYSVEDDGRGICFNVYCYNNQPGIEIDYATGKSREQAGYVPPTEKEKYDDLESSTEIEKFVININSKKFHRSDCSSVKDMKKRNRKDIKSSCKKMIANGYEPCQRCVA